MVVTPTWQRTYKVNATESELDTFALLIEFALDHCDDEDFDIDKLHDLHRSIREGFHRA